MTRVKLIDQIMTEIQDKNILNEVLYICLSSDGVNELIKEFADEFEVEYYDIGREPNKRDVEGYFGKKIVVDERISEDKKYLLLTKT